MRVKQFLVSGLVPLLSIFQLPDSYAQSFSFIDVQYPGANETIVGGINDAGVIVGTYGPTIDVRQTINLGTKGFIRNGFDWMSLQAFDSTSTSATSVNNQNVVVGYYETSGDRIHGFVYDETEFIDILPPNAIDAIVTDIDDSGTIIGVYSMSGSLSNNDLVDLHGYRAFPDDLGGYYYESFDFLDATQTFGSGRNNSGVEVGSAIFQSVFGIDVVGFVLPFQEFQYPDENAYLTEFTDVNDADKIIGNTVVIQADENLTGTTISFMIDVDDIESLNPPSLRPIELPGSGCSFVINPDGSTNEPCHRATTRINNIGQIVGYYDNNDGISLGFIGTAAIAGDYNGNGTVDAADFTVWQDHFGQTFTLTNENPAALTPGVVDAEDYAFWKSRFGAFPGGGSLSAATATVPEPSILMHLTFVAICWRVRRGTAESANALIAGGRRCVPW